MAFTLSFIAFTLLIVTVGLLSSRFARRSDEDYFLAGRSLGPWVAAISASASSESGWVTLGLVGWAFTSGVTAYWIIPGCVLGFLFNWFVIAARMRDRSAALGALTVPDLFGMSFREKIPLLRILSVIVILTAMWLYVAAQFNAAGKSFEAAFSTPTQPFPYANGVIIGAGIVLLYTVLGGFRAACWTDFLQGVVMVGTLVAFPIYLLIDQGGFGPLLGHLREVGGDYTTSLWPQKSGMALLGFLLGSGALGINLGYPGQPHVLVRFMAMRDRKDAVIGGVISSSWATLVYFGAVTVGLVVRAMVVQGGDEAWIAGLSADLANEVDGAGDAGLVLAARHLIPGVMSGLVLSAVLAAICSTADSQLVVAASSGANDIYARLIKHSTRRANMFVNRVVLLGLGIGAALLVIDAEVAVFQFVLDYGWAVLGAAFGPQIILLLLWKRTTYLGTLLGMLTGFVLALTWNDIMAVVTKRVEDGSLAADHWLVQLDIYNLTIAFTAALIVNILVSLLIPSRRADCPAADD